MKHAQIVHVGELPVQDHSRFYQQVADVAVAATTAALEAERHARTSKRHHGSSAHHNAETHHEDDEQGLSHGGHDAPNWSRTKSVVILLLATVLYAIIAGEHTSNIAGC